MRHLKRRTALAGLLGLTLAPFLRVKVFAAASDADPRKLVEEAKPVPLPPDIVWETNNDEPLIGSPKAVRGGTLNIAIGAFPLTFRLLGPNSNDYFASWNRTFAFLSGLVIMHPATDKFVPNLATHWSVQKDNQTTYFKLDRDAKWSDGKPITADDYVFTWRVMQSKFIVDPFQNFYAEQYLQSVDKVDDYTLRIVGTRVDWRPLYDYSLYPLPMHAMKVDKDWVERTNNEYPVVPGPYTVSNVERGQSVTFKRVANWWGDKKRYFIGLYNFDEIHLRVIQPERELDYVRSGELDITQVSSRVWYEGLDFPDVQNGWLRRARVYTETPSGLRGLQMNLEAPIFANRDFRTAMQYLLNFNRINQNLMFGDYYRKSSFFDGTPFANPAVHARPFDPAMAKEYLAKAGYHPPRDRSHGLWTNLGNTVRGLVFTRSDTDDILVNDKGEKASFTLTYDAKSFEPHLTLIQQDFRNAGVEMRLQLLEPGTSFQRALERKYEMWMVAMSSGFYPDPRQYLHTQFKNSKNNNDFWGFGTEEVDGLIKTYEENLDADARLQALYRIDQIVHDEAFYLPFWDAPFLRLVFWDYLQFPDDYLPRRSEQFIDWLVYWIDPDKRKALEEAKRDNKPYPLDPSLDKDFYGVKQKFEAAQMQSEGAGAARNP